VTEERGSGAGGVVNVRGSGGRRRRGGAPSVRRVAAEREAGVGDGERESERHVAPRGRISKESDCYGFFFIYLGRRVTGPWRANSSNRVGLVLPGVLG
jgi:hypothetical protein